MPDAVIADTQEGITTVTLNRPDKRNAIDGAIIEGLIAAQEAIAVDQSVRVVVLAGAGDTFCAGLDMANMGDMVSGDLTADSAADAYNALSPAGANKVQQLGWGWQELPVPVIAAVQGAALGGGLNLALGADIRVVAPNTKLGFVEISFGLLPDMSASQSLRHLVGLERAKELILTGRRFTGEQAFAYGLASTVADNPLEEAQKLAQMIGGRNPDAVRAGKRLINDSVFCSTYDGLVAESNCSRSLLGTDNQIEAVMSTLERRPARFTDSKA
ncbi:MAG: crotonase/enoyl-CoA hydratase family protein [Halieaceae bacterium]